MGSNRIRYWNSLGGIFAGLSQGTDKERDTGGLEVPADYYAEAIIYPVIAKGYLSFAELSSPELKMSTFLKALKMVEFDRWIKDKAEASASKEKDIVEYFD